MAGCLEQIDANKCTRSICAAQKLFALPKLQYILRAFPSYLNGAQLGSFDRTVCKTVSKISNLAFNDSAWIPSMLPVKHGGLGFRRAIDIALPGFISSLLAVCPLINAVLSRVSGLAQMGELTAAELSWSSAHIGVCEPEGLSKLS